MANVIRVKRKNHAEAAGALLLAYKKTKHGENFKVNSGMADVIQIEKKVFHYAATLDADTPMDEFVKDRVKRAIILRHKRAVVFESASQISAKQYQSQVNLPRTAYNAVLQHACNTNAVGNIEGNSTKHSLYKSSPLRSRSLINANQQSKATNEKKEDQCLKQLSPFHNVMGRSLKTPTTSKFKDSLTRSFQTLADKMPSKRADYVYDLYFCKRKPHQRKMSCDMHNIIYVQPCSVPHEIYKPKVCKKVRIHEDFKATKRSQRKHYTDEENDSIDEDERRLMFDEEEDLKYDSDDCEITARNEESDIYNSFVVQHYHSFDDDENNDIDYDDFQNYEVTSNRDDGFVDDDFSEFSDENDSF